VPVFLTRLIRSVARVRTWAAPAAVLGFVFATSWPLMVLAEPSGSPIVEPGNYWWWFAVTAATVGYGDFFPASGLGHVIGVYVIVGGIAALTTLFAQLAAAIDIAKGRSMQGLVTLNMSDHTVILGYSAGRTERIIDELIADSPRKVVLCAGEDVGTNPVPDRDVEFVRGDLEDESVLRRACAHRASNVLIDAADDNAALAMMVTVDHVAPDAHTVVALRDMARSRQMRYVSVRARCVQWHSPRLLTDELQTPGIADVYTELMTHGGSNSYSFRLTETAPATFGEYQIAFGRDFGATMLAARIGDELLVSPDWATRLPGGTVIYYVSRVEITPGQVGQILRAS
jgi:voltage-gated potassium channel